MIYSMTLTSSQYRLHAYVCGEGCVKWSDQISTVSYDWIYMNRPAECRYAVAGQWSVPKHGEEVVVWDLFDTQQRMVRGHLTLIPPKPMFEVDDLDAAIMATNMLYAGD